MQAFQFNGNLTPNAVYIAAAPFIADAERILKGQAACAIGAPDNYTNDDWQRLRDGPLSMLGNAHEDTIWEFYSAVCELAEGRGMDLARYNVIRQEVKAELQREVMEAIRI